MHPSPPGRDTLWAQGKVIAKYPKWDHRIMDVQTELSDPSRDWSGRRERHIKRL